MNNVARIANLRMRTVDNGCTLAETLQASVLIQRLSTDYSKCWSNRICVLVLKLIMLGLATAYTVLPIMLLKVVYIWWMLAGVVIGCVVVPAWLVGMVGVFGFTLGVCCPNLWSDEPSTACEVKVSLTD